MLAEQQCILDGRRSHEPWRCTVIMTSMWGPTDVAIMADTSGMGVLTRHVRRFFLSFARGDVLAYMKAALMVGCRQRPCGPCALSIFWLQLDEVDNI